MRRVFASSVPVFAIWFASFSILAAPEAIADTVQFDGSADAHGALTYIGSPIAAMSPAVIETLGVLVAGGSGTIASESAVGAHVLSIPAAAFTTLQPTVPIACESSAPPDASSFDQTFGVDVPGFLAAQSLACRTAAFDGAASTGARGGAEAAIASLGGGLVTAASAVDSTSSVHAMGLVTSLGFAELRDVGLLDGAITVDAIAGRAAASVRAGDPGAALADPHWEVTGLKIHGTPVTIGPGGEVQADPDTLDSIGVMMISAGWSMVSVTPEGDRAEVEVEALHLWLLSGVEISLGKAKAAAYAATSPTRVQPMTFGRVKQAFLPPR